MIYKKIFVIWMMCILCLFPLSISAWEPLENDADLRVGIISDCHILPDGQGVPELTKALNAFRTLSNGQLDGLLLPGDVVFYKTYDTDPSDPAPYDMFYNTLENAGYQKSDILAYAVGNHEYPLANREPEIAEIVHETFTRETGFAMNHHTEKNGFHFIAVGANDHDGYMTPESEAWLMQEIDKALAEDSTNDTEGVFPAGVTPDSTKPVFFLTHYPVDGTLFNAGGDRYSQKLEDFLNSRPQIIHLTAHWHIPIQLPQTIWQDGFTALHSPHIGLGYVKHLNATVPDGSKGTRDISHGIMIDVKDNVVYVNKMDYANGTPVGTPWIIDVPAIVSDRLDDIPDNDLAHCLYSDDKRTVSNVPVYPEGAAVSVEAFENSALVTFPNNAVMQATGDGTQQDGFTRGYKLEIETVSGTVVSSTTYQSDFYLPEEQRAETFTRIVDGLQPGTDYIAKVYPWSPLEFFGEPVSAAFTTVSAKPSPLAVRYEMEDYFPDSSIIKDSEHASGGKIVSSNQSGMVKPATYLPRDTENNPYTFSFDIDLPLDDTYSISYTAGYHKESTAVSEVVFSVDGKQIGTNDRTYIKDLSLEETYPWKYSPLMLYQKDGFKLSKGKHTVTVSVYLPKTTSKEQPFLFCTDYIQFTPETPAAAQGFTAKMEFEDYIGTMSEIYHADGSIFEPEVRASDNASGYAYLWMDSDTVSADTTARISIPFVAADAGLYNLEFVGTEQKYVKVYLDEITEENRISISSEEALDVMDPATNLFPVFNTKWFAAQKFSASMTLEKGSHELIFIVTPRSSKNDIVQYLDYAKISSEPVTVTDITRFELEEYASAFTPLSLPVKTSANASGGKYVCIDTEPDENHPPLTVTIPIRVEKAGNYNLRYIASTVGSTLEFRANGVLLNAKTQTSNIDTLDEATNMFPYFGEKNFAARNTVASCYLPAGEYPLEVTVTVRGGGRNDIAICADFFEFTEKDSFADSDGTASVSAIYDEPVSGIAVLALYHENQLVYTGTQTVTDTRHIILSVPCSAKYTDAKLFVWSSLTQGKPQVETKIFIK